MSELQRLSNLTLVMFQHFLFLPKDEMSLVLWTFLRTEVGIWDPLRLLWFQNLVSGVAPCPREFSLFLSLFFYTTYAYTFRKTSPRTWNKGQFKTSYVCSLGFSKRQLRFVTLYVCLSYHLTVNFWVYGCWKRPTHLLWIWCLDMVGPLKVQFAINTRFTKYDLIYLMNSFLKGFLT